MGVLLTSLPIWYTGRGVLYGAKRRGVVIFAVWDITKTSAYVSG